MGYEYYIYVILVLLFASGLALLAYIMFKSIIRFRTISKYHEHIKKTMEVPDVKKFLMESKKPFIELDQNDEELIVIWRDKARSAAIWTYVDKKKGDIKKILKHDH